MSKLKKLVLIFYNLWWLATINIYEMFLHHVFIYERFQIAPWLLNNYTKKWDFHTEGSFEKGHTFNQTRGIINFNYQKKNHRKTEYGWFWTKLAMVQVSVGRRVFIVVNHHWMEKIKTSFLTHSLLRGWVNDAKIES